MPLLAEGFNVCAVDTGVQLERIASLLSHTLRDGDGRFRFMSIEKFSTSRMRFDAALVVCVLHTIPDLKTRRAILEAIRRNVKKNGRLLVDVPHSEPYYRQKMTSDRGFRDGYVMGCGRCRTFYKEFDETELRQFVEGVGYRFEKNLGIRRHHALVFVV